MWIHITFSTSVNRTLVLFAGPGLPIAGFGPHFEISNSIAPLQSFGILRRLRQASSGLKTRPAMILVNNLVTVG